MINLETGRSDLSGQQVSRVVGSAGHYACPTPLGHLACQTRVDCRARLSCLGHRTH